MRVSLSRFISALYILVRICLVRCHLGAIRVGLHNHRLQRKTKNGKSDLREDPALTRNDQLWFKTLTVFGAFGRLICGDEVFLLCFITLSWFLSPWGNPNLTLKCFVQKGLERLSSLHPTFKPQNLLILAWVKLYATVDTSPRGSEA